MEERKFIDKQISVYNNGKKLVEFINKLNPTTPEHYAHIHAGKCKEVDKEGRRVYSLIGMTLVDYSKEKTETVQVNVDPNKIRYLSRIAGCFFPSFQDEELKIIPGKDEEGRSKVTKISFVRNITDNNGNAMKLPWSIKVENGTAVASTNEKTGGTYITKGTYKTVSQISINLTDYDFITQLDRVVSFINVWEMNQGSKLLKAASSL